MATSGRGVRNATKVGRASEQDLAPSDTAQDRINLVAQVTGWTAEDCAQVLLECDGDEQAAINAIIEGTAEAWKKVENKRTKPVEKPIKAPTYHKGSSDKTSRPPKADKTDGEHTNTQRDGKPDRRRSGNPNDRTKRPVGKENGSRPPAVAKEDHTAPQQQPGENAPTHPAHPSNVTNSPSPPTAAPHTAPTEPITSNTGAPQASAVDTSNTSAGKAPGPKPQRAWDQGRTWGAAPRSSSPSTAHPPRERNIPPRQQNQAHTQNQSPPSQSTTESPAPSAVVEKAQTPTQTSQAPAKPTQLTTQQNHAAPAPSVAAVPTTQTKAPSPSPAPATTSAAPTQQTQPQQPQQAQPVQAPASGSRYSPATRRDPKSGQATTTTWKPKDTQPKAPSSQTGASPAAATPQAAPAQAAVAPPQKPAVSQPTQPTQPQAQPAPTSNNLHQTQAPAVSQARHTPVVLPPTADVTAANIHLQFGSISGLGSALEVNKGDYDSQQRYGGGSMGGSGQLGGEVYQQDSHSMGVENDLSAIQQPHVPPFPYLPNHFGVGVPLQGLPPQHYQPSFDPNDPEHMMPVYYDPAFQYQQHPRDPAADPKFNGRNSGSYGPRDSNKFGQDAASSPQTQPQQGQQPQQSAQSPVQQAQHYMPVGQYGAGPMYYPYNYGPYQQPQYPPHFQRMLYKQPPYGFPNANPGYPGPSSTLGGYDENYKGSVYGAQMPPFMFPDSNMQNLPKGPSSQQAGLSTSPPKSGFSAGGPPSGGAADISSGAFKQQSGDYKGYQNTASNPQSFYNIAPSQSQFNQQQPISFSTPHNMLQQPQQPYQQQTRTQQQY